MIDCTNTTESSFQVLDAIDVAPPGSTLAQYVESGVTNIPNGSSTLTIAFLTTKISTAYLFDESYVSNTVDANPLVLNPPEIIQPAKTTSGFTVAFNGAADSVNYQYVWKIRIPTS